MSVHYEKKAKWTPPPKKPAKTSGKAPAEPEGDSIPGLVSITLSPGGLYSNSLENLREIVTEMGRTGQLLVDVEPEISNGETALQVMVSAKSLYTFAIKNRHGQWYYFDDVEGVTPPAHAKPCKGKSTYGSLGLASAGRQQKIVNKVISELMFFDGTTSDLDARRNIITLIFLVSEAARFGSMEAAMDDYLRSGAVGLTEYQSVVTAWETSTKSGSADVVLKWLP